MAEIAAAIMDKTSILLPAAENAIAFMNIPSASTCPRKVASNDDSTSARKGLLQSAQGSWSADERGKPLRLGYLKIGGKIRNSLGYGRHNSI